MKNLKRVLLLILILLFCIITAWFVIKKYYLFDMVHAGIEQGISEQIENDFDFTLNNFKLNLLTSKAQLKGFNLLLLDQSDTVGYLKGDILINVKGWKNIFFDDHKIIKDIELGEASLYYSADHPLKMKEKDGNDAQKIEINNVAAKGNVLFADKHKEQSGQLAANFNFSVALNYKSTDSVNVNQLIEQITNFHVSEVHYYLPDGFYQLSVEEVAFNKFKDIAIKKVVINPVDSRKAFAVKKKVSTDYISVAIDSLQLLAFDKQVNERIYIDQIQVYQPSIDVFKDKNYPDNQEYKAILVDLLLELSIPVHVREVAISDMFIKYTELANGADESGHLFFSEANATVSNITNVADSIQIADKLLIEAEAKFYGAGFLQTSMKYELNTKTGQFAVKGSLSPMDIGKANAIVSKLAPVRIKSGKLDKLRFNFSGTRNNSVGDMWFEYSDLSVEILEINYMNNSFTRNILSSFGNRMLRNSNPAGNGTFRVGAIKQERDTTKSMFHYWWISLQSGFLSTLGITEEKKEINYKSGEAATFLDKIGLGEK